MRKIAYSRRCKSITKGILLILVMMIICVFLIDTADYFEKKYALKADLSFNSITTYGSVTKEVLDNLKYPVHVYALFTPGEEDQNLISLLERYQAGSQNFSFSVENLAANPMLVHSISDSIDDGSVSTDSLIVYCGEKDRTRVLDAANYISSTYDPETGTFAATGAKYEDAITEAIAYVTSDRLPLIQMLAGHEELDSKEAASLIQLLKEKNYEISHVNLQAQDTLSADGLLMILSPRKDLMEDELQQIMRYISQGGALFITTDYSNPDDMPNFNALLRYYGIQIIPGIVVANQDDQASYYETPLYLMPYMQESEITSALIVAGQDRLMLAGSRAFQIPANAQQDLQVLSLLKSGESYIRAFEENNVILEKQDGDAAGQFDLAVYADKADTQGTHSRAFVIGNTTVFTDEWLYQNTYSTEFLMRIIQTIYAQHPTDIAIEPKMAFRPSLGFGSMAIPATVVISLPLLIIAIALLVLIPRKKL